MYKRSRSAAGLVASGIALLAVIGALGFLLLGGPRAGSTPGAAATTKQAAVSGKQLYISTMHPWIVQDHPGTCPICGMELVKMSPDQQAQYLKNHPG